MNALPGSGLRLRGYEPGDEPAIASLFERTYGRLTTPAHWTWKLRARPSPVENVFLVLDGERAVFHYAGIPARLRLLGRDVDAMLSVDAMTDPDYRRRGLLTSAGRHAFDAWRAAGIALTYGLPNQQWGSREAALGWRKLFTLAWRLFPLRPEALLARRVPIPGLARVDVAGRLYAALHRGLARDPDVSVRRVTSKDAALDRLWERAKERAAISIVRDADWISWRYLEPERPYEVLLAERGGEPAGVAAFRLAEDGAGAIAELFAPGDDGAARTLLRAALDALRERGADRAVALSAPGTRADALLSRAGFLRRPHGFTLEIVPFAEDLPLEELADASRWWISGGDFDVV